MLAHLDKKAWKSLMQQPVNAGSYAPQIGAIFGVPKQMKESFEEKLKAAKNQDINAGQNKVTTKNTEIFRDSCFKIDAFGDFEHALRSAVRLFFQNVEPLSITDRMMMTPVARIMLFYLL